MRVVPWPLLTLAGLLLFSSVARAQHDDPYGVDSGDVNPVGSGRDTWNDRTWGEPESVANPEKVLEDESYRFCHEDRYPMFLRERQWCELVGQENARCPALPAACEAGVEPQMTRLGRVPRGSVGDGDGAERRGEREHAVPADQDQRRARRERSAWTLPTALSGLARVLFFLLIAAAVAALVYAIAKNLMKGKATGDDEVDEVDEVKAPDEEHLRQGPVETDVDRLLRLARAAAQDGKFEDAIEHAYAALLRRLDGDGLIDMHHSRTNGDYVRGLHNTDTRAKVRAVVHDVERVQFGTNVADVQLFERILQQVLPLVRRVTALALVFCLALANVACGDGARGDGGGLTRSGKSPSGSTAVLEMLRERGADAEYRVKPLTVVGESVNAIIILPGGAPPNGNYEPLLRWVEEDGGRLFILGAALPEEIGVSYHEGESYERWLRAAYAYQYLYEGYDLATPPGEALVADREWRAVLVRGGDVYAVQKTLGIGEIFVFADEMMFTNIALTVGDNAELIAQLLSHEEKIQMVDRWTGAGASSPIASIHDARLTPIVAQLLLLLLLLFLWKGRAFGLLRDPAQATRRSFADHAKALGMQYARSGSSSYALGIYANWAIERLRERVPRSARRSMSALAEAIAERTGGDEKRVLRILVEAQSAGEFTAPPSFRPASGRDLMVQQSASDSSANDLKLMRELDRFLAQTSRTGSARGSEIS